MEKLKDLFLRYYRAVVKYFFHRGFSLAEAQDLAQDVFIRVYRGMESYRGASEWNYLMTIAHSVWVNKLRELSTQKRAKEIPLPPSLSESLAKDPLTGQVSRTREEEMIEEEKQDRRSKWLRGAIQELPENVQTCLRYWLGGLKLREIGDVMGITLDAVKSRLNDARHLLRDKLGEEPEGLDWPAGPREDDRDHED